MYVLAVTIADLQILGLNALEISSQKYFHALCLFIVQETIPKHVTPAGA
jgi:hypothetical protein